MFFDPKLFTKEVRESCIPIAERMWELSQLARRSGLLALQLESNEEDIFLLKIGMELVADGESPGHIRHIMDNFIWMEHFEGYELLMRLFIREGICAIQMCDNPDTILRKMASLLGEEYGKLWLESKKRDPHSRMQLHDRFFKERPEKAEPGSQEFERFLMAMGRSNLERVSRKISPADAAAALKNCSRRCLLMYCDSLSLGRTDLLFEAFQGVDTSSLEDVKRSQDRVMKIIHKMDDSGDIILAHHYMNDEIIDSLAEMVSLYRSR
jgi:hypothetical protein